MAAPDKASFNQVWPKCFIIFLGIVELLAVIVLVLTELGNIASNFWVTNVFAGGWCGLVMLVHFFALFVAGCCSPGPSAAFRALIITIVALLATATLISFDAVFIARPTTCILTPSCEANALSTTMFSYYFQQAFFTAFKNLGPFKTYSESQAKFLFQTVQLGVGCLCFVLCIIYIIIYFVTRSKAAKRVAPSGFQQAGYQAPQPGGYRPSYQPQQQAYRQPPPPRAPQAAPGEVPWSTNRRY